MNVCTGDKIMVKPSRRIKLSKNMKPFVSRVVRDGAAQRAFTENIGHKTGKCVSGKVREGMTGAEIHDIAKECAPKKGTVTYTVGGGTRKAKRKKPAE